MKNSSKALLQFFFDTQKIGNDKESAFRFAWTLHLVSLVSLVITPLVFFIFLFIISLKQHTHIQILEFKELLEMFYKYQVIIVLGGININAIVIVSERILLKFINKNPNILNNIINKDKNE